MWLTKTTDSAYGCHQICSGGAMKFKEAYAGDPSHPVMKALMPLAAD